MKNEKHHSRLCFAFAQSGFSPQSRVINAQFFFLRGYLPNHVLNSKNTYSSTHLLRGSVGRFKNQIFELKSDKNRLIVRGKAMIIHFDFINKITTTYNESFCELIKVVVCFTEKILAVATLQSA